MSIEAPAPDQAILEVADLTKHFAVERGLLGALRRSPERDVRAIDGISCELGRGEVLALVGESGCGKTTTARSLLGLHERLRRDRSLRQTIQMVFQDPYESLNPSMTIAQLVAEPLHINRLTKTKA